MIPWLFAILTLIASSAAVLHYKRVYGRARKRIGELEGLLAKPQVEKGASDKVKQHSFELAHDLKAPLRGIIHLIDFIKEDMEEEFRPEVRKYFSDLQSRATMLHNLVNEQLKTIRYDEEDLETPTQLTDTRPIIDTVKKMLEGMGDREVRYTIQENLPSLEASPVSLIKLFQNLISNAIRYNNKSVCEIEVGSNPVENGFEIWVKDNGPGIPERFQSNVFTPGVSLGTHQDSSGLGLAIVKRIVEEEGKGNIWIQSKLGEGALVRFTWLNHPAAQHSSVARTANTIEAGFRNSWQ